MCPNQSLYFCGVILMKKDMQPKKNSKLNKYLKIFLYFLLVTGVCAILPIPGGHLWRGLHVFCGIYLPDSCECTHGQKLEMV